MQCFSFLYSERLGVEKSNLCFFYMLSELVPAAQPLGQALRKKEWVLIITSHVCGCTFKGSGGWEGDVAIGSESAKASRGKELRHTTPPNAYMTPQSTGYCWWALLQNQAMNILAAMNLQLLDFPCTHVHVPAGWISLKCILYQQVCMPMLDTCPFINTTYTLHPIWLHSPYAQEFIMDPKLNDAEEEGCSEETQG